MSRIEISRRYFMAGAVGCGLVHHVNKARAQDSDASVFFVHPRGGLPPLNLADRITTLNKLANSVETSLNADQSFRAAISSANEFALGAPLALPKSYDWRTMYRVPPVKDQQQCGSCFIFAAVGALECAYLIAYKQAAVVNNRLMVSVSEQQALDCTYPEDNCIRGGWHEEILFYAFSHGLGGSPPYYYTSIKNAQCTDVARPYRPVNFGYVADTSSASDLIASDAALKKAVLQYGPIVTAVFTDDTWDQYYRTLTDGTPNPSWPVDGIAAGTPNATLQQSNTSTNHEVVIVGWDDTRGVWILRNSWSKGWGADGYMYLKYGTNLVGYGASWVRVAPPESLSAALRSRLTSTVQAQAEALTKLHPTISFSSF